jgi:uncharacterized protein YrrD
MAMHMEETASLREIGAEGLAVTDPAEDVRGRKVLDTAGEHIGDVDDLLVDHGKHIVRFLRVAAGGFLGLGETKFLIPVDAITSIDDEAVHVNRTREHVASGPRYDPDLINKPHHLTKVYEHYGSVPFWAEGYTDAGFPYYP